MGHRLSAVDVQPTGLTLVIAQSGGHPTGRLQYGSDYTLEVFQDGVWEQAPYAVEGDVGWTAEAYLVSMEASVEENVQWAFLYGSLPPGTYRIRKTFMDFRETGTTIPRPIGPPLRSGECRSFPAGQAMGNAGDAGIKC